MKHMRNGMLVFSALTDQRTVLLGEEVEMKGTVNHGGF